MQVTAAICTWNRAALLGRTLAEMEHLRVPAGVDWEVLVVNNCCTDETDDVIRRYASRLPIRRLYEPEPGKSHALNAAAAAIRGDLILWTDDDVLVHRDWLAAYVAAANALPEASFFGGPIEPWFEIPPPSWLTGAWPRLADIYAVRSVGDASSPIDIHFLPYGANFAIRSDVQRRFPYDPRLGRVGPGEVRGEETDVIARLLSANHRGFWVPAARVRHFIARDRLTLDYLRRFFYGHGQTAALMDSPLAPGARIWRRARLGAKIALNQTKYHIARRTAAPDQWVKYLTKASYYRGQLAGCSSGARNGPSSRAA